MPASTLRVIKHCNVSPSDWDSMLMRWGFKWDDETMPFSGIETHIKTHSMNGSYHYPLYED